MRMRTWRPAVLLGSLLLISGASSAAPPSCPAGYSPWNATLCSARPVCPSGYYYPGMGRECKSSSPTNHRSYTPSCPGNTVLRGNNCYAMQGNLVNMSGAYPPKCTQGGFLQGNLCVVVFPMTVNASCPSPGSFGSYTTCVAPKR